MTGTRPRRWPTVTAAVVALVAAVVAAAVLWSAGSRRYRDNVGAFARAPVGCDTTLEFERAGEFVLYLETTGRIDALRGDCDLATDYDRARDGLPRPALTLRAGTATDEGDDDGAVVALAPTAGVDYDTDGFVGTAYRLAEVPAAGAYVLTVDDVVDQPYAIAVGKDPAAGVAALRWGAVAALVGGVVLAGLLVGVGVRRGRPTTPPASAPGVESTPWLMADRPPLVWPTAPPAGPPVGRPVGRPEWPPAAPPTHGPVPPWAPPAPHGEREW